LKTLLLSTVRILQAIAVLLLISVPIAIFNPVMVIPMWMGVGWLACSYAFGSEAQKRRYWTKRAAELGLSGYDAQLFIATSVPSMPWPVRPPRSSDCCTKPE
jgi:hypothetical protein